MPINLPLSEMTLHEKLVIMESLWEDLIQTPESVESPAWHDEVLKERSQQIAEGHSRFSDWETAKANIRNKLS